MSCTNSLARVCAWLVILGQLTACSIFDIQIFPANSLKTVAVESSADCNGTLPVAMDIVFVHEAALTPMLSAMNGPDWFAKKHELLMRYTGKVAVASFEIVPSTVRSDLPLPKRHRHAKNVLLFANYTSPGGQYVAELGGYSRLKISLQHSQYRLVELN